MAKKTKLIAVSVITLGAGAKAISIPPEATFDVDADEGEWLIAQGAARLPVVEAEAEAKTKSEKAAADKAAAEKAEADRLEVERLGAAGGLGSGEGGSK